MSELHTFLHTWLGADAERVWTEYRAKVEADAEALRNRQEECPD